MFHLINILKLHLTPSMHKGNSRPPSRLVFPLIKHLSISASCLSPLTLKLPSFSGTFPPPSEDFCLCAQRRVSLLKINPFKGSTKNKQGSSAKNNACKRFLLSAVLGSGRSFAEPLKGTNKRKMSRKNVLQSSNQIAMKALERIFVSV